MDITRPNASGLSVIFCQQDEARIQREGGGASPWPLFLAREIESLRQAPGTNTTVGFVAIVVVRRSASLSISRDSNPLGCVREDSAHRETYESVETASPSRIQRLCTPVCTLEGGQRIVINRANTVPNWATSGRKWAYLSSGVVLMTCRKGASELIGATSATTPYPLSAGEEDGALPSLTSRCVEVRPYSRVACSFDPIMFKRAQCLASGGYQVLCPN
jgi:hypothetical protein